LRGARDAFQFAPPPPPHLPGWTTPRRARRLRTFLRRPRPRSSRSRSSRRFSTGARRSCGRTATTSTGRRSAARLRGMPSPTLSRTSRRLPCRSTRSSFSPSHTTRGRRSRSGSRRTTSMGRRRGAGCHWHPVTLPYSTADRSEKNHPIYLYSWYHSVHTTSITSPDDVLASQKSAIQTYANLWVTGMTVGGDTHRRTGPYGHVATGALVSPTVRHRDFR
jgi:hypothetical protein